MTSKSFETWRTIRAKALNEIVAAHHAVGGTGPGRRVATQQLNHAFAVLLSSQFQGFCRDLHSECARLLAKGVTPISLIPILEAEFIQGRKLDKGNPNPGNIGADFARFGLKFWDHVIQLDPQNSIRKSALELLNEWRNSIAHQDFNLTKLGGFATLQLGQVRRWRVACDVLAISFDEVMRRYISTILGASPW